MNSGRSSGHGSWRTTDAMIILDGGMGQELVRRSGRPATPLWSTDVLLEQPEIVTGLHADYLAAGADVITLASYTMSPERLARNGCQTSFETLQDEAFACAEAARALSDRPGSRIAACLPPLVASYRPGSEPGREAALASYRRIVERQHERCDLLLCETMASIAEASFAAEAAVGSGCPVWVALTVDDEESGRLRSGEAVADAVTALEALGVDAILLNCSTPEAITAAWSGLDGVRVARGAYANGFVSVAALEPGGSVEVLERREDLGPDAYAERAADWVRRGATIVGGCCETTPAHISVLAKRFRDASG